MRKMIDIAHLFTNSAVGTILRQDYFPKFEQLLRAIKLTDGPNDKQIAGLGFAMVLSKAEAFEALPGFLKGLPYDRLKLVRM